MASIWQKTLFYLGLVDEDEAGGFEHDQPLAHDYPEQRPVRRETSARSRFDFETGSPGRGARAAAPRSPETVEPRQRRNGPIPERPAEHHSGGGVSGRRVEPPLTSRRRMPADNALAEAGVIVSGGETPSVRTITDDDMHTEIIAAKSYSDAQALADYIRASTPVVLDLRNVEPAMVRRLVDFASGLTYALGGSMRKIGQGIILVTPANVNITRDERRRLADMGYYQSTEG